ncbi:hypothetical protein DL769_000862 [Monosporascus sp. CRB-8-3]|nr:hypothetical protein DL769_000862 [Monosporascus sp. CRB-8-3]
MKDTKNLNTAKSSEQDTDAPPTIIDLVTESKLLHLDKTLDRLFAEMWTVAAAGFEITGVFMRLVLFHVYTRPEILKKLRAELTATGINAPGNLDLKVLEKLPFIPNEELYPDPQAFNPERWIDPELRQMPENAFNPFIRGTEICLGMQYVNPHPPML